MRTTIRILFVFAVILSLVLVTGCSQDVPVLEGDGGTGVPSRADLEASDECSEDADCICGGVDTFTGNCFLGNREYHERYVDASKVCPDFCSGIAGNLVTRCVNDRCMQVYGCISDSDCDVGESCKGNACVSGSVEDECKTDSDCMAAGCSGSICTRSSADEEGLVTTCEFLAEYECLSMVECGCREGSCSWSSSPDYERCVADAREQDRVLG